jgi:hypothetical protein
MDTVGKDTFRKTPANYFEAGFVQPTSMRAGYSDAFAEITSGETP